MKWNLQNTLASAMMNYNTNGDASDKAHILVYSGTMPTAEDVEDNWQTTYNRQGTLILGQYYADLSITQDTIFSTGASVNESDTIYYRDGTATWALYFPVYSNTEPTPGSQDSDTSIPVCILDVSNGTGTGILKLSDTTVSGSMPSFVDFGFSLSNGV